MAWILLQFAIDLLDAEERVQDISVHETLGLFCRLVAHEAVDERVRCRLHENTGEGTIEEVRLRDVVSKSSAYREACGGTYVVGDGLIEAFGAEVSQ